jgi:hypothetical protein
MTKEQRDAFQLSKQRHEERVAALEASGRYAEIGRARKYLETRLGTSWRSVLHLDEESTIQDQLGMNDTMILMVHLFARGVLRRMVGKNMPVIVDGEYPLVWSEKRLIGARAISKRNIARIIGKSPNQVQVAIDKLRKHPSFERIYDLRIVHPMFMTTGIMLDVMTEANLSFSFMVEEYSYAKLVAFKARIDDAIANDRQTEWCAHALKEKRSTTPTAEEAPAAAEQVAS